MTEKETQDFLATARKQFDQDCEDEKSLRDPAAIDLRFGAGDQWNERLRADRIAQNRPVLTFSRCHTFVQSVANEARQSRGEIKFIPAEDGDKDTAEIYEGMARHIQYNSKAKVAYETAVDYSAGCSFGYYGFLPEYCDDDSFNQEIKVRAFLDPFQVYGVLYPACFGNEPDHAFVIETLKKGDFQREHPDSSITDWDGSAKDSGGWIKDDEIRIAEYWWVDRTTKTLYLLEDGSVVEKVPEGQTPKSERSVTEKKIKFCKTNGVEILPGTETEWVGKRIPIFAVLGKGMIVDGKPQLFSVIRFQRSAQELINLYKSRIAETLGTSPIQPYLADPLQVEEHKNDWAQLNKGTKTWLPYKRFINGQDYGVPQRQVFEAPIMSLSEAAAQEIDDMKATAGIYDASLGNKSNESSGIALARRQQQSDVTNMHYIDNLGRSFDESGSELAYVIPKIYDTPRTVRILGEDEAPKIVKINQQFMDGNKSKQYMIGGDGAGKYDVLVTVGRSFSSKRLESFDMIGQVIQGNPQVFPMIADVFFKNSDIAGADQLAERFKLMLPPQIQQAEDKQNQTPLPPQVQQVLQQQGQMIEQLTQQLNEAQSEVAGKKMEVESKQAIEMAKIQSQQEIENAKLSLEQFRIQNQTALEMAKLESKESTDIFKAEVDMAKTGQQLDAQAAARESDAAAAQMGANE